MGRGKTFYGRLAQWQSASFTPKRPQAQSLHRPLLMLKSFKDYFLNPSPCDDCGPLPVMHWQNYLNALLENIFPNIYLPYSFNYFLEKAFVNLFCFLKLVKIEENFNRSKISLRTTVFMDEAEKRGIKFFALKGPVGYLNQFYMEFNGKKHFFEGLPRAEWLSKKSIHRIDDKIFIKNELKKISAPIAEGKSFYHLNWRTALKYGGQLGFPLMVKPRTGSISHHITTNIKNENELKAGIRKALQYSPFFIVEKYLENLEVYRATVIDEKHIACIKRVAAHIIADGKHSIKELIEMKNKDSRRGLPRQKDTTLYKLVIDKTSEKLLAEQGYDLDSVPPKNEIIYLQEKVILDLGADLFEVSQNVHPDNARLFKEVAALFGVKLVGIDFIAEDISKPWQDQQCAVIELNSLPYIDMHHYPTYGEPMEIAKYLCDMVLKYYA